MATEGFTPIDIHHAFAQTDYGQQLSSQVRYDRYKPEDVTNERWVELLGADVNNLTHMPLTYGLTRVMIKYMDQMQPGFLAVEEADVLKVAALIHDWGESVVGDITYSDKTEADEAEEQLQLATLLGEVSEGHGEEVVALIHEAASDVVFNPDSKLGHVFNAIERVGYLRTALRAADHIAAGTAPDCEDGLRWLVADVLTNHPIKLMEQAEMYAPVHHYLASQVERIDAMFAVVGDDIFGNYPGTQQQPKRDAYFAALAAWQDWAPAQQVA